MDIKEAVKSCPVTVTQNLLMGKWKLALLWVIGQQTRRFNELQRLMPNISRGVLTQQLRELERDGLVNREVYREVPPKVEYSLTEIGKSFIPVMMRIMEWGVGYIKQTANCSMDICLSNNFSCQKCYEMMRAGAE
ncbi:MAG TPA: helix-turn-helix domain-containing protein [Clostridia bacterium]|nr:helix-turn-helix domain-containing protein [Clostridia bacterium]